MLIQLPEQAVPERKVPVIVKDSYTVYLERTSGLTFVHCDVHVHWSKSVRNCLLEDWNTFLRLHLNDDIYALHTPGDSKHATFLKIFRFKKCGEFTDPDGVPTELYRI